MTQSNDLQSPAITDGANDSAHSLASWKSTQKPKGCDAVIVLEDGSVFWGRGLGTEGERVGEVCFNTAMSGYQEIMTDPSYACQIITFTFPHIGNVGINDEDTETLTTPTSLGAVFRMDVTQPSSWRATERLDAWLKKEKLIAITGIDTRSLTRCIRDRGAPKGCLAFNTAGDFNLAALQIRAASWPGLEGLDLAKNVAIDENNAWNERRWDAEKGYQAQTKGRFNVVAVDFGVKRNILRSLVSQGCDVTVVPPTTSAKDILALRPSGVFLSNGPGDPAATGSYAIPMIQRLLQEEDLPIFGICLGHQMLALALGAETTKMHLGHRGANHPVMDHTTGKVEITSQNHGFAVNSRSLPGTVEETHVSLFDGTNQGIALRERPVFSVQYHPEASPGPQDSQYLFKRFRRFMEDRHS